MSKILLKVSVALDYKDLCSAADLFDIAQDEESTLLRQHQALFDDLSRTEASLASLKSSTAGPGVGMNQSAIEAPFQPVQSERPSENGSSLHERRTILYGVLVNSAPRSRRI